MGLTEWDGTPESAHEINRAFNDVLDVLVNANMWTGNPPYRGKNAAEQVRMLVQRATTGSQLATDILAALTAAVARAEAAEAALTAVPDYVTYYTCAWEAFEANSDGPEPLDFTEWLAAGKPEVQP